MAGKNGKKGNDVAADEVEDKATPTPETPTAAVTAAVEAQKPNPTPEGESTYISQMMFGQKTYDEQMKVEHNLVGLNRTDEISQLGGASKTEVDLAQMKIFSTERIGDELYAAIERGDTTKVQSLAGLNSDRRMTEAQILVLLKAKREAEEDEGRRIANEQYLAAEEKSKEDAEKEIDYMRYKGGQSEGYSGTTPERNFELAGWDDAGNYTDSYGNTYDPEGNITAADGTTMDPYGIITHTDGTQESVHGDIIQPDAEAIEFKDDKGNVVSTMSAEDIRRNDTPPEGEPALTEDGSKMLLLNAYQMYLTTEQGGGLTPEAAKERAQKASERDLAAFKEQQDAQAGTGGPTANANAAPMALPTDANGSPSARAQEFMREAGIELRNRPTAEQREHGTSLSVEYLKSIPGYRQWANENGRQYRDAHNKWEKEAAAARARGEKPPTEPKRKSIEEFWKEFSPTQAAALKAKYAEAMAIDQEALAQRQQAAAVTIPGNNGSTPPVLGDGTDPNADPAIAKLDTGGLQVDQPAANAGFYDEFGGYYDENGGYDDGMGNYYAADGGFYDNKGGYTWPDGAYQDRFGNYVDTEGNMYTTSGQYYKKSDYPDEDFKGLLTTNAWKQENKDPFRKEVPPAEAFQTFIDGKVWDPSQRKSVLDSDQPVSLFTTKDGALTTYDTGNVWDPMATPLAVNFGNAKTTTAPWLNNNMNTPQLA